MRELVESQNADLEGEAMMDDYTKLTDRQLEVLLLRTSGMTILGIAKELGCTKQNVWTVIKSAEKRLISDNKTIKKDKQHGKINQPAIKLKQHKRRKARNIIDFSSEDIDISVLSPTEKNVYCLRCGGKKYIEIAEELGLSISSVGEHLRRIKSKLLDTHNYKAKMREKNKYYYNKNRDKRILNMVAYNKKYYLKNKEEILKKRKEKLQ